MAKGKRWRNPANEQLWRERVERLQSSGLSVREFCRRENLPEPSMYGWRREIARRDAETDSMSLAEASSVRRGRKTHSHGPKKSRRSPNSLGAFLPLQVVDGQGVTSGQSRAAIEIVLPANLRVLVHPGFDPFVLRQVVETLSTPVVRPPC
jgi:hypothetical protein